MIREPAATQSALGKPGLLLYPANHTRDLNHTSNHVW